MARMGRQFTARAAALIAASVCLAVGHAAGGNGPDGQPAERPFQTRAEFESFAGPRAVSSAEREAVVRGAWAEGRVPRVEWDPETPFLAVVASLGIPVLIRNSVVTTWPGKCDGFRWGRGETVRRGGGYDLDGLVLALSSASRLFRSLMILRGMFWQYYNST